MPGLAQAVRDRPAREGVENDEDRGGVARGPNDGSRDRVAVAVQHAGTWGEGVILLETVGSADVERDRAAQVRGTEFITGHSRHEQEEDAPGPAQPGSLGGQGASAAAALVGPEAPRSRSAFVACSIPFCAAG